MINDPISEYTDAMWLSHILQYGELGPVSPLDFKPACRRLFYYDHTSRDFYVLPIVTRLGFPEEDEFGVCAAKIEYDGHSLIYSISRNFRPVIEKYLAINRDPPLCWRIFCSHLQFSIYTRDYDFPASGIYLDFGDVPKYNFGPAPEFKDPILTYCTAQPTQFCLVDPFFINSRAYFKLQEKISQTHRPLSKKKDCVFWRGSASGVRSTFIESQRYLLCRKMETSLHRDKLDFGIIDTPKTLLNSLRDKLGDIPKFALPAERVSPETFSLYRYGVDVDGNSNSWGGFFTKMLSLSYLFRVKSWGGYQQWYHPRLQKRELYSEIKADLSDFDEIMDSVFHLSLSEISDKAQSLHDFASSMSVYDEIELNNQHLFEWFKQENML